MLDWVSLLLWTATISRFRLELFSSETVLSKFSSFWILWFQHMTPTVLIIGHFSGIWIKGGRWQGMIRCAYLHSTGLAMGLHASVWSHTRRELDLAGIHFCNGDGWLSVQHPIVVLCSPTRYYFGQRWITSVSWMTLTPKAWNGELRKQVLRSRDGIWICLGQTSLFADWNRLLPWFVFANTFASFLLFFDHFLRRVCMISVMSIWII